MLSRWYKHQGFLVAFYFPTVYHQFLNLQQYGWTPTSYHCNGLHLYIPKLTIQNKLYSWRAALMNMFDVTLVTLQEEHSLLTGP